MHRGIEFAILRREEHGELRMIYEERKCEKGKYLLLGCILNPSTSFFSKTRISLYKGRIRFPKNEDHCYRHFLMEK